MGDLSRQSSRDHQPMPIDYYAVCESHMMLGPPVWRPPADLDELRGFLTEHGSCDVRVYDEHRAIDEPYMGNRYDPGPWLRAGRDE